MQFNLQFESGATKQGALGMQRGRWSGCIGRNHWQRYIPKKTAQSNSHIFGVL